jgi:hypothetical protein
MPLTVALTAGLVMKTRRVFCTLTYSLPVPVRPVASVTVALTVCEPLVSPIVFQAQSMVEALVRTVSRTTPSTMIENRLLAPVVSAATIRTVARPRTVWPGERPGKLTWISLPGVPVLLTVTERVAVAVAPPASVTVSASVWAPSG